MAKKKGGGGGGANWMDTYGDMVTLLLCFFVLLYSMSTISEDKMKAIIQSFNPNATQTMTDPVGGGGPSDMDIGNGVVDVPSDKEAMQKDVDETIDELFQALQAYAKSEGLESAISVEMDGGKVYIKFNQNVMFGGDSPVIREEGQEILLRVAKMLDQASGAIEEIRIQGHTARYVYDEPNPEYEDWELSSRRALNAQYFLYQNSTIHPSRLVSEAFGQWRPEGDNKTAEGIAINRRVVMIVSGRNIEEELKGLSIEQTYIEKLD